VVDGDDYDNDNDDDEGRGKTTMTTTTDDDDNKDGRYGGRDGHHQMRKGRRHDNKTIHNNKIGKRYLG
jgi:hypothetical protein